MTEDWYGGLEGDELWAWAWACVETIRVASTAKESVEKRVEWCMAMDSDSRR